MESSAPGVVAAPSSLMTRVRRGAAARESHAAAKLAGNQEAAAAAEAKVGADVGEPVLFVKAVVSASPVSAAATTAAEGVNGGGDRGGGAGGAGGGGGGGGGGVATPKMTSAEVKPAEAPETEAEMKLAAKQKKKKGLGNALLLAQMTEQAFMEHQLAACAATSRFTTSVSTRPLP